MNKNQQNQIEKLHSLANIGRFSAGIIHDLINPLNALMLNLEMALIIETNNKKSKNYLKQANLAGENLKTILISAKEQINDDKNKKVSFKVKSEIEKIIKILSYQIKKSKVNIKTKLDKNIEIYGPKAKFIRVINNLIINAIEACQKGDKNYKQVQIETKKIKNKIVISVSDNGCGISNSIKKDIFKPFVSKKNGLGLGLYMVKSIIEHDFNGKISLSNNKKTKFTISINC